MIGLSIDNISARFFITAHPRTERKRACTSFTQQHPNVIQPSELKSSSVQSTLCIRRWISSRFHHMAQQVPPLESHNRRQNHSQSLLSTSIVQRGTVSRTLSHHPAQIILPTGKKHGEQTALKVAKWTYLQVYSSISMQDERPFASCVRSPSPS